MCHLVNFTDRTCKTFVLVCVRYHNETVNHLIYSGSVEEGAYKITDCVSPISHERTT